MKAYHVSDYEGYGHIVFAETRGKAVAKSLEWDLFPHSMFTEVSATRAPYKKQKQKIERYEKALESVAYKQFRVEPKRVIVKMQSLAREALVNTR
ncbi:hypothetical protein [Bacillus sp. SM2101]|uniref:hypothetical protein n=1 Tax=Bacillus sp. SM2101 TaxID=2805366 RepID=UPI001BDDE899|nr:hypothetical protein [Bacillus sp. SM2101]